MGDPNDPETPKDDGKVRLFGKEFPKRNVVGAGLGLVCVTALAGVGIRYAVATGTPTTGDTQPVQVADDSSSAQAQEQHVVRIGVTADGWDAATSSPVIAHVTSADGSTDYYHAYAANTDVSLTVPSEGDYTVSFISPVNADGSIYRVPDATSVTATEADDGTTGATAALPFTFQKVEATDVTADELTGIIAQVTQAVQKGDDTLTGDAGTAVTTLIGTNAKAAPNADQTAVDAGTATATAAAQTATSVVTGTTSGSGSTSTGTSAGGSSSGSTDQGSSSGASASGSDNSGSSSSSGSQTTTIHHDAVYTTVHHDAVYTTVHHDATYTTVHHDAVTERKIVDNYTGQSYDTLAEWQAYADTQLDAGNTKVSYTVKDVVVQAAYDEQVVSTPAYDEQVLVSAAYDEQVLVTPAWDETR